jgi:hypothetical protein
MRLSRTLTRYFLRNAQSFDRASAANQKLLVPMPHDGLGPFRATPQPLARAFLLERHTGPSVACSNRLRPAEALHALARHSYSQQAVVMAGLQPTRLRLLSRVAELVPVHRLEVPAGLDRLGEVVAAIRSDMFRQA